MKQSETITIPSIMSEIIHHYHNIQNHPETDQLRYLCATWAQLRLAVEDSRATNDDVNSFEQLLTEEPQLLINVLLNGEEIPEIITEREKQIVEELQTTEKLRQKERQEWEPLLRTFNIQPLFNDNYRRTNHEVNLHQLRQLLHNIERHRLKVPVDYLLDNYNNFFYTPTLRLWITEVEQFVERLSEEHYSESEVLLAGVKTLKDLQKIYNMLNGVKDNKISVLKDERIMNIEAVIHHIFQQNGVTITELSALSRIHLLS